jgi:hypothetical protein
MPNWYEVGLDPDEIDELWEMHREAETTGDAWLGGSVQDCETCERPSYRATVASDYLCPDCWWHERIPRQEEWPLPPPPPKPKPKTKAAALVSPLQQPLL